MSMLTFRGQWVQHHRAMVILSWALSTVRSNIGYCQCNLSLVFVSSCKRDFVCDRWWFYVFHTDNRQQVLPSTSYSTVAPSPWYTILEDCSWLTFPSAKCYCRQTQHPVHQMQYYIPAPQSPNKTLWCQIDTLVNDTSWFWYCLATAETTLLESSSGWWAHGSRNSWCSRDAEGSWMAVTIMVL